MRFLHTPRQVRWRNWLFQFHLWSGLIAGLYFLAIGLTGSVIVYKKELERAAIPRLVDVPIQPAQASFQAMVDAVANAYPAAPITNVFIYPPGASWSFRVTHKKERVQVYVDPYTGRLLGEDRYGGKFLQWVYDFHVNLLAGDTGELANGIGGFALAVMSISGAVVWWPGLRHWRNGLRFARGVRWKRQNYDVHKLLGLGAALLLFLLSITGGYWTWPKQYEATLAWLTQGPAKSIPPAVSAIDRRQWKDLDIILQSARRALPDGQPTLFRFASRPGDTHSLKRFAPGDWRTQGDDTVYIDPATAEAVRIDYHREQPLGVRLQRDIYALHFGTFGGGITRALWLILGLAPGVLFVSGLLMYWNRVLAKKRATWNRPVPEKVMTTV